MAARSALRRAPHKTAGGLLLVAGTTIVMGIITAEALYTAPYNARMEISDLGASETGVILQPSATIFNATMLAAGAMILVAAWFAHQALHRRVVTIPTGLLGIGVLGVGIFPGNIHPQHPLFAFTAFVAGGLAVLLSAKVTAQPLRAIFAGMGAVSVTFTLASVFLLEWGPFARLDLGGVERWMVYPILLWLVGFGGYLTARRTAEGSGASLPDTAARSLDGHRGLGGPGGSEFDQLHPGEAVDLDGIAAVAEHLDHLSVFGQNLGVQHLDAELIGGVGKPTEQCGAQPLPCMASAISKATSARSGRSDARSKPAWPTIRPSPSVVATSP